MSSIVTPQYFPKLFEKQLSETDSKHRFSFPAVHLHHLCSNPHQLRSTPISFKVIDCNANPFIFRLRVRKDGFLKPEITGDWLHFIRAKNLKPDDMVVFYKHPITSINHNGIVFTVAVKRAVRVFGAVFGYAQFLE